MKLQCLEVGKFHSPKHEPAISSLIQTKQQQITCPQPQATLDTDAVQL